MRDREGSGIEIEILPSVEKMLPALPFDITFFKIIMTEKYKEQVLRFRFIN